MILLCGSLVLPFFMLKNAKNTRGESDVGDETYSGQGKANEDKVESVI